jgi:hypothetical protein
MAKFPPIDPSLVYDDPDGPMGNKTCPRSVSRHRLSQIAYHIEVSQYANCWGFAIFRTYYGGPEADQQFARAVELLDLYASSWALEELEHLNKSRVRFPPEQADEDPQVVHEIKNRYHNVIVEDRETLENATGAEVGRQFESWVVKNMDEVGTVANPRFDYCIMLDEESILNILTRPETPDPTTLYKESTVPDVWVKVVTSDVRLRRRLWLRVDVYEELWNLWFMQVNPEFHFEEHAGGYNGFGCIDMPRGFWGDGGAREFLPRGVIATPPPKRGLMY